MNDSVLDKEKWVWEVLKCKRSFLADKRTIIGFDDGRIELSEKDYDGMLSGYIVLLHDGVTHDLEYDYVDYERVETFKNEWEARDYLKANCKTTVDAGSWINVEEFAVCYVGYNEDGDIVSIEYIEFTEYDWEYVYRVDVLGDSRVRFANDYEVEYKFNRLIDDVFRYEVEIEKDDCGYLYTDDLLEIKNEFSKVKYESEIDTIYDRLVEYFKSVEEAIKEDERELKELEEERNIRKINNNIVK